MELPSYFQKYLKKIQPTESNRERAIQLHKTLRKRLGDADDSLFSEWFAGSFLYGSYARNTAIQPLKDIDVCIVLDLCIEDYTPEQIVRRLKKVLEDIGYEGKTAYQRRSIRIDMSQMTLDVVPVVPIEDEDVALHISDRTLKEWIHTYPKAHMEAATRINEECGGRYKPLVKIVKAWYRYQAKEKRGVERPQPKGFTLEALVAQYQDPDAPTYAEAFVLFLQNLMESCGDTLKSGSFPQVSDPGMQGEYLQLSVEEEEASEFAEIVEESLGTARLALAAETVGESAARWRDVFGSRFPDAPDADRALRTSKYLEDDDSVFDAEFEEEVSSNELSPKRLTEKVKIRAQLAMKQDGKLIQNYPSGSRAIAKNMSIKFSLTKTTVKAPYDIRWIVKNHGKEAREANHMGHESISTWQQPYNWERTQYRGSHFLICELVKDGVEVARTKHIVNIK